MKTFAITSLMNPNGRYKGSRRVVNSFFSLLILIFFSTNVLGQAGDLSQIRNGSGAAILNNQKQIIGYDSCGKCWVNGNAGATNAHYTEGMSIAYRSLLTGLKAGTCYEYELGYDTYHGAMAIDYLTHFQRLEPHGPFGHAAEVIKPLALTSGSKEYNMTVIAGGFDTYAIPAPSASGILSGVFDKNGNPKNVSQQALTSFNALPDAERLMTIYNGDITFMYYVSEAPIVLGGADAETRIRVRFMAKSDSAILAWGGHIGSRLDWGYTKDNKGKLIPLSAGGISGSPYHMRQKAMDSVNCNTGVIINNISGFGNQDRSLSAAAVNPPPECNLSGPLVACPEATSLAYSTTVLSGVTYQWALINNSANAIISGSSTGSSIIVTPNPDAATADFTPGGTFNVKLTTTANSISTICYLGGSSEPGSNVVISNVTATATATPAGPVPVATAGPHYTLGVTVNGAASLYTYSWSQSPAAGGSLSANNVQSPTFTATVAGDYTFTVTVTEKAAPNCSKTSSITKTIGAAAPCPTVPRSAICQQTTNTYTADVGPVTGETWTWSVNNGATVVLVEDGGIANGGQSIKVRAGTQNFTLTLTKDFANSLLTDLVCTYAVTVKANAATPQTTYIAPLCTESKFKVQITNPQVDAIYTLIQLDGNTVVKPAYVSGQLLFTNLNIGQGYSVSGTHASCPSDVDSCGTFPPPNTSSARMATETITIEPIAKTPSVIAAPNPFNDRIRFSIKSPISGRGSLELYNMLGQKVKTIYQGQIQKGMIQTFDYNVPGTQRSNLIYVFRIGDQRISGKLIGLK